MSRMVFQQDGARPHTAVATQALLTENIPHFWNKTIWPANSPDLSPIENLWSILGTKLEEESPPPTTLRALEKKLTESLVKNPPGNPREPDPLNAEQS